MNSVKCMWVSASRNEPGGRVHVAPLSSVPATGSSTIVTCSGRPTGAGAPSACERGLPRERSGRGSVDSAAGGGARDPTAASSTTTVRTAARRVRRRSAGRGRTPRRVGAAGCGDQLPPRSGATPMGEVEQRQRVGRCRALPSMTRAPCGMPSRRPRWRRGRARAGGTGGTSDPPDRSGNASMISAAACSMVAWETRGRGREAPLPRDPPRLLAQLVEEPVDRVGLYRTPCRLLSGRG